MSDETTLQKLGVEIQKVDLVKLKCKCCQQSWITEHRRGNFGLSYRRFAVCPLGCNKKQVRAFTRTKRAVESFKGTPLEKDLLGKPE